MNKRKKIRIDDDLTVRELPNLLEVPETEIIKILFDQFKLMRTVDGQTVAAHIAREVTHAFGFDVQ